MSSNNFFDFEEVENVNIANHKKIPVATERMRIPDIIQKLRNQVPKKLPIEKESSPEKPPISEIQALLWQNTSDSLNTTTNENSFYEDETTFTTTQDPEESIYTNVSRSICQQPRRVLGSIENKSPESIKVYKKHVLIQTPKKITKENSKKIVKDNQKKVVKEVKAKKRKPTNKEIANENDEKRAEEINKQFEQIDKFQLVVE